MNGLIVDAALILLILIFGVIGYYKGFLRELISLMGVVGSIVISYFAYDVFADFLNNFFGWGEKIAAFVSEQVTAIAPIFETATAATVEDMQALIDSSGAGLAYKEIFKQIVAQADFSGGAISISSAVGAVASSIAMIAISFAILFLLLRIVTFVLDRLLSRIPRKSAVGVVNKWLGLAVGFAKGAIAVVIIIVGAYLLSMVPSIHDFLNPYITDTYLTKYAYDFLGNFLLGISII